MFKTLKRLSEVYIVIETNIETNQETICFVETSRLEAERDIEHYCIESPNTTFRIQIEKIYSEGIVWVETFD